jgi:hypothetical protein
METVWGESPKTRGTGISTEALKTKLKGDSREIVAAMVGIGSRTVFESKELRRAHWNCLKRSRQGRYPLGQRSAG